MSVFKIAPENKRTIPWKLVVIFLLFSAVIILAGDYYYKSQRNRIFIEQQNNLSAIATLKIGQIALWHKERLGDANVITGNEPLINRIKQYFGDENQPGIKREIIKWMESFYEENDYSGVSLVDTLLKIRLASSSSDPVTNEGITEELKEVIRNQKIIIKDLFRAGNNKQVQMDILVPLIDPGNKEPKIFGIVILRIDPGKFLFPLIQSWPTPSKSAETLLLRKDGDSVLYLNELRHQKNTALNLKLPVGHKNLLAAKVVNGFEGIAEGVDYRKIPVVGSLSKIRGMPWYMVAKIDEKEIQAPLKRFIYITGSAIVLLILIVVSVFGLLIWNQRLRFYKQQLNNELDRKKAEDALRDSENKFRQTFDLSPVGIVMVGLDKRFLRCNGAFSQSLGYLPEELVGKTFTDVTYPEDIRIGIDEMMAMIKGEIAISHVQKRYVRKDGQIVWGEVLISLIRDNKGHPQYFLTIVQDITERKLAEEALLENEDKFKYIFDHSLVGKSITLPSGEINVNRAFSEMLGYKPEELKKMNWADISYPADIELTNEALGLILSGEKDSVRFIKRYIHKNGSVVWADVGTSLRRDAEGKPLYFMTSTNDITERKNAESQIKKLNEELERRVIVRTEQLEAANKELEAFSYSVSHDLRAPLRSVHGYTKILLEEYENKLDNEGKRICGIISSSATHMGELIDDLLSFSKIGRSSLNPSLIDMEKMVRNQFEGKISPNEKEKIKLYVGKLHKAFGDVTLLGQVWFNLLTNAIKYSSKNEISEISIGSSVSGKMITYFIKDNGVGFDMQYAHKLFGVFQRLHSEAEFEGNGVGLAIVQRIILKHGGRVWAEGAGGKGATFYFSLPVQDKRQK
jgi:PAS domain S-box-containing protein